MASASFLPDEPALCTRIIEEVASHLPQRPPAPRHSPLRGRDWLVGLVVTVAYTVVVGYLLERHFGTLRGKGA